MKYNKEVFDALLRTLGQDYATCKGDIEDVFATKSNVLNSKEKLDKTVMAMEVLQNHLNETIKNLKVKVEEKS